MVVRILVGHVLDKLRELPDESVRGIGGFERRDRHEWKGRHTGAPDRLGEKTKMMINSWPVWSLGERCALPRPKVEITKPVGDAIPENRRTVTVTRDGKAKSYVNDGASPEEAIAKGIEDILNDPQSIEWLP